MPSSTDSRRMLAGAVGATLLALPAWPQPGPAAAARPGTASGNEAPNLLVIHCDQLNFRALGCYRERMPKGQAFVWGDGVAVPTPNIDALAGRAPPVHACALPACASEKRPSRIPSGWYSEK